MPRSCLLDPGPNLVEILPNSVDVKPDSVELRPSVGRFPAHVGRFHADVAPNLCPTWAKKTRNEPRTNFPLAKNLGVLGQDLTEHQGLGSSLAPTKSLPTHAVGGTCATAGLADFGRIRPLHRSTPTFDVRGRPGRPRRKPTPAQGHRVSSASEPCKADSNHFGRRPPSGPCDICARPLVFGKDDRAVWPARNTWATAAAHVSNERQGEGRQCPLPDLRSGHKMRNGRAWVVL